MKIDFNVVLIENSAKFSSNIAIIIKRNIIHNVIKSKGKSDPINIPVH